MQLQSSDIQHPSTKDITASACMMTSKTVLDTAATKPKENGSPQKPGSSNVSQALIVMSLTPATSYKAAEPTFYPWTIRHDSFMKAFWDWIVLLLVIYTTIEIPYYVAFVLPTHKKIRWAGSASEVINLIVDFLFIIDMVINFRTTYVCGLGGSRVVVHPRRIAWHYFKTWFVVDFLAAIPFELLFLIMSKVEFNLIGLLKTARLLRLVRVARKLDRYSEYGVAVSFLLMSLFTLSAHWFACIWYTIGRAQREDRAGWINVLSRELTGTINGTHVSEVPISSCYVSALYFALSSLTSVGFGNVASNTNAEKTFAIVLMIFGALMYAIIFGNLTAIIQRLYSRTARYHKELTSVKELINFYEIPSPLSNRLEEYTKNSWTHSKGAELQKVLKNFPECLQNDVCYHLRQNIFKDISAFKDADNACLRSLAMKFRTSFYMPEQCIIRQGDPIQEIYFVASGVIEIIKDGKLLMTLGNGDVISCDYKSLHHIPKANAELFVRSLAEIHSIEYDDLLNCLRAYPAFGESFFERLAVSYRLQEFNNINEEFVARSRRFSNARRELASYHKFTENSPKKDKNEASDSTHIELETRFSSSPIPRTIIKRQIGRNEDEKEEEDDEVLKVNDNFAERLDNIEKRLSLIELNMTENFDQIMSHLQAGKEFNSVAT